MARIMAIVGQRRQHRQDLMDAVGMTQILVLKYLDMLHMMNGYLQLNYVKLGVGRTVSSTTARRTGSSRSKTQSSYTLEIRLYA